MNKLEIPERYQKTLYITISIDPSDYFYGELWVTERAFKSDTSRIVVGKFEADVQLEYQNINDKRITILRDTKKKIIDEASEKAQQIDEEIESLLAIEHKSEQ